MMLSSSCFVRLPIRFKRSSSLRLLFNQPFPRTFDQQQVPCRLANVVTPHVLGFFGVVLAITFKPTGVEWSGFEVSGQLRPVEQRSDSHDEGGILSRKSASVSATPMKFRNSVMTQSMSCAR